jgi:hypothetical protein
MSFHHSGRKKYGLSIFKIIYKRFQAIPTMDGEVYSDQRIVR